MCARVASTTCQHKTVRLSRVVRTRSNTGHVTTAAGQALFSETLALVALKIPKQLCTDFTKRLKGHILNRPRVKPIMPDESDDSARLVLMAETITGVGLEELPDELRAFVLAERAQPRLYKLELGYEHLTVEQALRRIIPAGMEVPSAFEQCGHVAHVNLRAEHEPYKFLIGQVLLEKNTPRIRSVVNKVESITNKAGPSGSDEKAFKFRVFPMEVLAGVEDLRTSVRENGARFELDYREVYWNSRLETEHKRMIELLPPNSVVADAFAGIGPFAVPAAMRGCAVYANDLNPKSHEYLCANVKGNKVERLVRTYNLDGREFIRKLLSPSAAATTAAPSVGEPGLPPNLPFGYFSNVIMNLPASALTFLDAFAHAFDRRTWRAPLPVVHCYCFSKAADPAAEVLQIAEETIGCKLPGATVSVVRDVSPHKLMLCVRFRVPEEIAWTDAGDGAEATASPSAAVATGVSDEDRSKRQRTAGDVAAGQ